MALADEEYRKNFRMLVQFFRDKGFENNPIGLMDAMTGWIESGSIPAMCQHDCYIAKGQAICEHQMPSVLNYFQSAVVNDACLLVNLKRLGIKVGYGLSDIRQRYGKKLDEVMG